MKLVPEWRRVVSRSLSFWLIVAAILVMAVPELWYGWTDQDYNPYVEWWAGILLLVAVLGGRLIKQDRPLWQEWLRIAAFALVALVLALLLGTEVRAAPATEAQTLRVALPLISSEEGERLVAYIPIAGDRPTICFGETNGVTMGMRRSHAQCLDMLRRRVVLDRVGLHRYYTPATIARRLPPTRDAAYLSTAYNCGVVTIGRSTATRRLNAGDVAGGCAALTWFDRAGNRVIRGLFARRKREEKLCLQGI